MIPILTEVRWNLSVDLICISFMARVFLAPSCTDCKILGLILYSDEGP
jgi:hypothetical protein